MQAILYGIGILCLWISGMLAVSLIFRREPMTLGKVLRIAGSWITYLSVFFILFFYDPFQDRRRDRMSRPIQPGDTVTIVTGTRKEIREMRKARTRVTRK